MASVAKGDKVFVAGHRGLVGSAIVRELERKGYDNILTRTHGELDLCNNNAVVDFFEEERPDVVVLAAARVGGILANREFPAEFIYSNLAIQTNVIHQSWLSGVKKLLFLGSSCIYPKMAPQPLREEFLLSGPLEPTNDAYAVAKIAGVEMCRHYFRQYGARFVSVMPTNLYGPGDNFDLETSHVLPAMIHRFHRAKVCGDSQVTLWGTGSPMREFLYVDDMASACVFVLENYEGESFLNVGTGLDVSIRDLACMVKDVVGFEGDVLWDTSKPDGTPRKLLDVSKLNALGWEPEISLEDGIRSTYRWFCDFRV